MIRQKVALLALLVVVAFVAKLSDHLIKTNSYRLVPTHSNDAILAAVSTGGTAVSESITTTPLTDGSVMKPATSPAKSSCVPKANSTSLSTTKPKVTPCEQPKGKRVYDPKQKPASPFTKDKVEYFNLQGTVCKQEDPLSGQVIVRGECEISKDGKKIECNGVQCNICGTMGKCDLAALDKVAPGWKSSQVLAPQDVEQKKPGTDSGDKAGTDGSVLKPDATKSPSQSGEQQNQQSPNQNNPSQGGTNGTTLGQQEQQGQQGGATEQQGTPASGLGDQGPALQPTGGSPTDGSVLTQGPTQGSGGGASGALADAVATEGGGKGGAGGSGGSVQQLPQPTVSPGTGLSSQYGTMGAPASSATQQGGYQGGTQQSSRDIIADASRAPSSPSTFSSSQQPAPYSPSSQGGSYGQQGGSSYGGASPSFGSAVANFFGAAVSTVVSTAGSVSSAMPSPSQVMSAFTPAPTQAQPQMQQPVMLAPAYTPTTSAPTQQTRPVGVAATQGPTTAGSEGVAGVGQGQQGGGGASAQLPGFDGKLSLQDSIPILEGYAEPSLLLSGEVDAGRKVSTLLRSAGVTARDDRAVVATGRTAQGVASALGRETPNTPAETGSSERPGGVKRPDAPSVLEGAAEDRDTASFVEAVRGIQEKLFTQGVDAAARDTWRYFQEHVGCQLSGGCADEGSVTIVGRVPLLVNAEAIKSSFAAYGEKLPSPTVVAQLKVDLPSQPTIATRAGIALSSLGQGIRTLSTSIFSIFGLSQRALPVADTRVTETEKSLPEGDNVVAGAVGPRAEGRAAGPGADIEGDNTGSGSLPDATQRGSMAATSPDASLEAPSSTASITGTLPDSASVRRVPAVAGELVGERETMFGSVLMHARQAADTVAQRIRGTIARILAFFL